GNELMTSQKVLWHRDILQTQAYTAGQTRTCKKLCVTQRISWVAAFQRLRYPVPLLGSLPEQPWRRKSSLIIAPDLPLVPVSNSVSSKTYQARSNTTSTILAPRTTISTRSPR